MSSRDKHRILLDVLSVQSEVKPIYESLPLQEERPDGEVFFRASLDTTFTFVRSDYDAIASTPIGTEVTLIVQEVSAGPTYTEVYRGVFSRTDVEFDQDNKIAKVKPEPSDSYRLVMDALNKEYNLIGLNPAITQVRYRKKPIIQAYLNGSGFLSNFTQGNYWETPLIDLNPSTTDLLFKYRFFPSTPFFYVPGDSSINPDISGKYSFTTGKREDNVYEIFQNPAGGGLYQNVIRRVSDSVWVYQMPIGDPLTNIDPLLPGGTLTSNIDGVSKAQIFYIEVLLRYYTDLENISGTPTYEIPDDDIVAPNENYTRIIGLNTNNHVPHSGHSPTPTPFGQFATDAENFAGEYFSRYIPATYAAYPLAKTDWGYYSLWFEFDAFLIGVEEDYSTIIFLKNAYKLPDVISAFLAEIDPSLTHLENSMYSEFFYGSTPVRSANAYPMMTPKSNILLGDYDQPAKKAPLRFGELLQFLKDFYQVYWYILDGKFILEHIEFFEKGGSYTVDQVSADLTLLTEVKTGKALAYKTNKFTYAKTSMPGRIEFNWMDDQSPVFEGYPIEMLDSYVDKGNVQTKSLSKFSSDIDFIITSPGEISKDGFGWLEVTLLGGITYSLVPITLTFDGMQFQVQNGYASLTYAHDNYHKHQAPCENIKINNSATTASSIIKTKVQPIRIPVSGAPSAMKLITTGLGTGKVWRWTRDLIHNIYEMTLRHDQ